MVILGVWTTMLALVGSHPDHGDDEANPSRYRARVEKVRATLPLGILVFYLAVSVVTAVAYGTDKSAAQSGRRRTRESTLHLLALIGGWPGALVAQRVFHHKSRKRSFQLVFLATIALNCCALLWFWWTT
jgi:uncharacterized membrane protein YsdA (DUF1294 family)